MMARLGMVIVGVALLLLLPRDPWPPGLLAYLLLCSAGGSCFGQSLLNGASLTAFLVAWVLTWVLFMGGGLLLDLYMKGRWMIHRYRMWALMIAIFAGLYTLAGTLSAFPIVELVRNHLQDDAQP